MLLEYPIDPSINYEIKEKTYNYDNDFKYNNYLKDCDDKDDFEHELYDAVNEF